VSKNEAPEPIKFRDGAVVGVAVAVATAVLKVYVKVNDDVVAAGS